MTSQIAFVALVPLAGCASLPKRQHTLQSSLGHPVAELHSRYSAGSVSRTMHQWTVQRRKADWSVLATSAPKTCYVSVTVDGKPVQDYVTTPGSYEGVGGDGWVQCLLTAHVDESGTVTDVALYGDPWACRKFS